ncbi:MAG: prolyl oligopeptidase family serine peptidase [Bacteroidota bacterium]|nr:prolyl oligopeptidase family serine peptidase [Bacteroidota bacterium]
MRIHNKHIFISLFLSFSLFFSISRAGTTSTLKKVKYNYLLHVPEDYDKDPNKKWPVIFYLHGRHASGKNLESLERYGLPYYLSKGKKMEFIVVSPQCPWDKNWSSEDWFNPVYDEVSAKLRVDGNRIYLIGMSMGGFGTWALANRMPDRFAAISPMCGGADVKWADQLSKIPTWVFHGTADRQIPISRSEVMVKALEKINPNVIFTRLVKQGHDISKQFNNDNLYDWLLKHSLEKLPFWQESLPFLKTIAAKQVFLNPPLRTSPGYASIH